MSRHRREAEKTSMPGDEELKMNVESGVDRNNPSTWKGLFKRDCSDAHHDALKQDRSKFLSGTVAIGRQEVDDGVFHELANCRECGSSITWPEPLPTQK